MMAWWVNGLALLVSVTVFSFIGYFILLYSSPHCHILLPSLLRHRGARFAVIMINIA